MNEALHPDTFHGTKKDQVRKTARLAYRGLRRKKVMKRRISRSLALVRKALDKLKKSNQIPMEDYNLLRTCLSHYKEFMPVDQRFKI
tara:strand:- start:135 stop:395 length:261 start_codon:yes stop_codon:yes gene_type:complete